MNIWLVILVGGLLTYLTRLSFIFFLGQWELPGWLLRLLRYVPPAVLSALVFIQIFRPDGELYISPGNLRLIAGLVAALVAWRTRNALLTIVIGMLVLLVLQAVVYG